MLLLFVIGAAGVGGYLYIKMKGVKPASRKNQPDPDADYSSEIRSAVLLVHGEKAHSRYFSETAYSKLTEDNKEFRDFLAEWLYRKLDYPETLEEAACSPAFYKKIRDNFSILLRHFRWDRNDIFLKFGIIFFLHHRP